MLFSDVGPSRDKIYDTLAQALSGDSARVYVDASLLIHSYEISPAARDELLAALEGFGDKVVVPLWAARETWDFMRGRISGKPLVAAATRVKGELDKFRSEALRYVDDDTVAELTKEQFQARLDEAAGNYRELINQVANFQPKSDVTTSKLAPFIEQRRLKSDLSPIVERVSRVGVFRASHGIPPGFADVPTANGDPDTAEERPQLPRGKGKQKNAHGDLIVWFEALADCKVANVEHLVILTRDVKKGDWVYAPDKLQDEAGSGLQQNNGGVTLPSPLLVSEAMSECPNLQHLHVVSLEMLANVLQRTLRIQVPSLAAAIQASPDRPNRRGAGGESRPGTGAAPDQADRAAFESSDMIYELQAGDPIDELLGTLAIETWDSQNEAALQLEPLLPSANRSQLMHIGRSLVAAANESALDPAEVLARALAEQDAGYRPMLLVGMLAAVYVEDNGEPKKPKAAAAVASLLYEHEADAALADAYDAILNRLAAQKNAYLALPRDHAAAIPLIITAEGQVLRSVTAFNTALLEEDAPASRRLRRSNPNVKVTVAELVAEIAREFVVPAAMLQANMLEDSVLQIPESLGFVAWGPNTGSFLR